MGDETISTNGEPDTKEAEALASALNHSAERAQTLWFSFLTVMLYLAIATGTTTHRMLFLESPLTLPVLNIPLPLFAFYILTPFIFVVFHFYMLLNLVLLARSAKAFDDALVRAFPQDGELRETFRMRIENTLFVQLLVGGRLEREGIHAKLLSLMALITLALAPVALLLMIQIKFLPYHSEWITWWHRGLLALDLALVWTLWPGYRSGWGVRLWPKVTRRLALPSVLSAAALIYAVMVATFPDERIYVSTFWLHGPPDRDRPTGVASSHDQPNWYHLIAPVNTLDLRGEDLIEDAKLTHIIEKNEGSAAAQRWEPTLSLRDRDLTEAELIDADVRHVDFSGATLNRANLQHVWAKNAHFNQAKLRGTWFHGAHLQGAELNRAAIQGAVFFEADLKGASLYQAQLQGASLMRANLQGAELGGAELQGASLDDAHLQGAGLEGALLLGASLERAKLQGAQFDNAELQGATLDGAELQNAWFVNVFVWRADARKAKWKGASISGPLTRPASYTEPGGGQGGVHVCYPSVCDWTTESLKELRPKVGDGMKG